MTKFTLDQVFSTVSYNINLNYHSIFYYFSRISFNWVTWGVRKGMGVVLIEYLFLNLGLKVSIGKEGVQVT